MTRFVAIDDPKQLDRDLLRNGLQRHGLTPVWVNDPKPPTGFARRVEYLITSHHRVPVSLKRSYPRLKMISMAFTGYDAVDRKALARAGVALYYVPGYATHAVAELNVLLALALLRKLPNAERSLRTGGWDAEFSSGGELAGRTVGLIGTGAIGTRSACLFRAFGCAVLGWSRSQPRGFVEAGGTHVELKQLCRESNVVVLSLALSDETRGFVDTALIRAMKRRPLLVNTARAELVDRQMLVRALRDGSLSGAAIDVHDPEPIPADEPLMRAAGNVILTPHLGYKTVEALATLAGEVVRHFDSYFSRDTTIQARNRL